MDSCINPNLSQFDKWNTWIILSQATAASAFAN